MESLQLVPKEGIRERKKRLTHERICDVASKLFVEQGYSNTTIDAIAALADISKPTFFNYFSSKIAVLHEIIDIMDEQFVSYISDELDNALSAVYTFFAPEEDQRSLGTFAVLWLIEAARNQQKDWLYLGYWIKECQKMNYKTEYHPIELYLDNRWLALTPE